MISAMLPVALMAGLSAASPLASRQVVPNYPPTSTAQGFVLSVNVTDPSADFDPPVNNQFITTIHDGAAMNLVGITSNPDNGRVFYQNGTAEDVRYGRSNLIADTFSPYAPFGLRFHQSAANEDVYTGRMDVGAGDAGVVLTRFPEPYSFLLPEQFLICDEPLEYYGGQHFNILKRSTYSSEIGDYVVPENCVAVRLVPECRALPELPADAISNHDFVANSQCYTDVSELDWTTYGP